MFQSLLKFLSIFHFILPYQDKLRAEAKRNLYCTLATLSISLQVVSGEGNQNGTISAGHFPKLRNQVLIFGFANRFLIKNIFGFTVKKLKIYRKFAKQQHRWNRFFAISKKKTFLRCNVSIYFRGCNYIVQHPLPSFVAVKQLFSMGAAILSAKRASLKSRYFQRLVFLKGNLDFLKWQGVALAHDDFDDMPSMSSK